MDAHLFPVSEPAPLNAAGSQLLQQTVGNLKLTERATMAAQELLIERCSDPLLWYRALVGRRVPYLGEWPEGFKSREPAGFVNLVRFGDARVVGITP